MIRPLVFLDTETTGLDPAVHEVVEVAWAIEDGPLHTLVLPHAFTLPSARALIVNGYLTRGLFEHERWATDEQIDALLDDLDDVTLVGANPHFDAQFLSQFYRRRGYDPALCEPWHHRLLDLSAYAMGVLGLDKMPGLSDVADQLRKLGFDDLPWSDHTAERDTTVLRGAYRLLQSISSTSRVADRLPAEST